MRPTKESVLAEAMKLTAVERVAIADELIDSLVPHMPPEFAAAWSDDKELRRRVREIEGNDVVLLPGEEVTRMLRGNTATGSDRK